MQSAGLHRVVQRIADVLIETAQYLLAAINERNVDSEPVEDVRKLQRDISAACDQDAPGQLVEMKRLVRGDAEIAAGNDMAGAELARRRHCLCDKILSAVTVRIFVDQPQRGGPSNTARSAKISTPAALTLRV